MDKLSENLQPHENSFEELQKCSEIYKRESLWRDLLSRCE